MAYLAVTCGTGVVVPLDKSLPENEIKSLVERSEVEAILYTQNYNDIMKKLKAEGVRKAKKPYIYGFNIT